MPLYDETDVLRTVQQFVAIPYHHALEPLPGVKATFFNSGHILGSALVVSPPTPN